MTDARSKTMVGSSKVGNCRLLSKINEGKLDEIEPFFNALALDVGNDPRVFRTNFIDELNHPSVIDLYNRKDKAAFREQLRGWLSSALSLRVNSLIETENTRDKLDRAIIDLTEICQETKLLQGRGGLFGTNGKKADLQRIENLVKDLHKKIQTIQFNEMPLIDKMIKAAKSGDLEAVKQGIASGIDINAPLLPDSRDDKGLLYYAAQAKHYHVVDYLIEAGANVDLPLYNGYCVLHYAAMWGDVTLTKKLINANADLNKRAGQNVGSVTPLFTALENNNRDVVKDLIEAGADFNLPRIYHYNKSETMPLSHAVCFNDQSTIDLLLTAMVNKANPVDCHGDESIYSQLLRAFREFKCREAIQDNTKAAKKLRAHLRATLCDVLGKKIDRLIAGKELSRLEAEMRGLEQIKRDLYFIINPGEAQLAHYLVRAEKKKTAMITIEKYIFRLGEAIAALTQNPPNPNDELINAAISGDVDLASHWLSRGADVSYVNQHGQTPLYFAIVKKQIEMVRFLMSKNPKMTYLLGGPDTSGKAGDEVSYLNLAVNEGMLAIAEILLDADPNYNINQLGPTFATLLFFAAQDGHTEMVKFLIKKGADINLGLKEGGKSPKPPLGAALKFHHYETAEVIIAALDNKIRSLIPSDGNYHALINYLNGEALNYQGSPKLKKVLRKLLSTALTDHVNGLRADGDIAALRAEKDGLTSISKQVHLLEGKGGLGKLSQKKKDLIKIEVLITALESKIQTLESANDTSIGAPLTQAAAEGDLDQVKTILGQNIPIDSQNCFGQTALLRAASFGKLDVVAYLIENGANLDLASQDGHTPLLLASQEGHLEVVRCLIAAGANVNHAVNENGYASLHVASAEGHFEVAQLLIQAGATIDAREGSSGCTALYFAAEQGKLAVVQCLIDAGADLNTPGLYDRTPLYAALQQSYWVIVTCLVEAGANVNCATTIADWPTVFELASYKERLDFVQLFENTLTKKIRSLIPGCAGSDGLEPGDYTRLIATLNGEEKHYQKRKATRTLIRETLVAALNETVNPIARDGDRRTKKAVKAGLEEMLANLKIIQKSGVREKTAMVKIKGMIQLLAPLAVSKAGLYSANFTNDTDEGKPDPRSALGYLNSL